MVLVRSLCRPFWVCNSCRLSCARAFTTSGARDLPRQNRRVVKASSSSHSRERSSEGQAAYQPLDAFEDEAQNDTALLRWKSERRASHRSFHAFEDEALSNSASSWSPKFEKEPEYNPHSEPDASVPHKARTRWKSDGISNISNKSKGTANGGVNQDLSIPWENLAEDANESPVELTETRKPGRFPQSTGVKLSKANVKEEVRLQQELPWYLRSEYSDFKPDPGSPFLERQELPELPELPPKHLQAILENLSKEQGLEYLTLLDLRSLDPPPALGNQLMMIIATARGEKHLHVAAARFASHMRRTYDLSTYADGLVGRSENRIQKRRKLKKARALANVGHADPLREIEEGLATSWVCVRVGYLDPHPDAPRKQPYRPTGMIGFGEESNKITLVVQFFTEERRATVDLEGLWGKLLENSRLRSEGREKEIEPGDAAAEGLIDKEEMMDARRAELKQKKARARFGFEHRLDPLFDAAMEDVPPEAEEVASR